MVRPDPNLSEELRKNPRRFADRVAREAATKASTYASGMLIGAGVEPHIVFAFMGRAWQETYRVFLNAIESILEEIQLIKKKRPGKQEEDKHGPWPPRRKKIGEEEPWIPEPLLPNKPREKPEPPPGAPRRIVPRSMIVIRPAWASETAQAGRHAHVVNGRLVVTGGVSDVVVRA